MGATIGISDFAQQQLGDIVYVDLPEIDTEVDADSELSEIESTKATSPVVSPVTGTVVDVNEDLADSRRQEFGPDLVIRRPALAPALLEPRAGAGMAPAQCEFQHFDLVDTDFPGGDAAASENDPIEYRGGDGFGRGVGGQLRLEKDGRPRKISRHVAVRLEGEGHTLSVKEDGLEILFPRDPEDPDNQLEVLIG